MELYIEGNRIELFSDENITLNSSVQNIKDISKVFTDFTQSFTVPASPQNNKVFEHWYDSDITDGYDARVRKDASIYLNSAPYKNGRVELNRVQKKKGVAYAYTITFFGRL